MYNYNLEARKLGFNEKTRKIRNGIWVIHLHNHQLSIWYFYWDLRRSFPWNLSTSTFGIYNYPSFYVRLSFVIIKTATPFHCWKDFSIYCILNFALSSFLMQPRPPFIFLQFNSASDTCEMYLSNKVLLSKAKLNYINTKAMRVCNNILKI